MKPNNVLSKVVSHAFIAGAVVGGMMLISTYQEVQMKARAKEGYTLLSSAMIAIKATEAEQGIRPLSLEESGFNPSGLMHYNVSLTEDTVDARVKDFLPKSYYPFADKDKFQLLASAEVSTNTYHICKDGSETKRECLWITVKLDNPE